MMHSNVFVRDVPPNFNTEDMRHAFEHFGPILSVKILEPRKAGDKRFGFIKYSSLAHAKTAIDAMNGVVLKGHKLEVREAEGDVNMKKKASDVSAENDNLFVRGFPTSWGLEELARFFSRVGIVVAVKILGSKHPNRGAVGLVRYSTVLEARKAIILLKGEYIDGYGPVEIKYATVKDQTAEVSSLPNRNITSFEQSSPSEYDSYFLPTLVNTQKSSKTLFICNLSPIVTKLTLYELFAPFGAISSVLLGLDENYFCTGIAFVIFSDPNSAITARDALHGTFVRNSLISVSLHD